MIGGYRRFAEYNFPTCCKLSNKLRNLRKIVSKTHNSIDGQFFFMGSRRKKIEKKKANAAFTYRSTQNKDGKQLHLLCASTNVMWRGMKFGGKSFKCEFF